MSKTLTVGMAHFRDFDGVYFTVMSLKMYHDVSDVQLVVIDNSPGSPESKMLGGFLGGMGGHGFKSVTVVEYNTTAGTSASRNRIFHEATGDVVIVLDCHVLLTPGSLVAVRDYFENEVHQKDIVSGPLLFDNLVSYTTHFDDFWRAEMWGVWGTAWRCCDGGVVFSVLQDGDGKEVIQARLLPEGRTPISSCHKCGKEIPQVSLHGYEKHLQDQGYTRLGGPESHEVFEIPGMGLGAFACTKEHWPGFNKHARGFGGEELYIHGKIRAAGGRAVCHPQFRWAHRFGRPNGVPYPLTRFNKVRNYVLEFQELGWDLTPVREHFVDRGLMSQSTWDAIVEDAINIKEEPQPPCGSGGPGVGFKTIDEAFAEYHAQQRDLNQHMPKLRDLATQCETVVELTARRESTLAFLAARPKRLISYQTEVDVAVKEASRLAKGTTSHEIYKTHDSDNPAPKADLVFIDTKHTFNRVSADLNKYGKQSSRYIVLHDTDLYRTHGEDGGPGLFFAISAFLEQNPEWSLVYHTTTQYGLTVLSCQAGDKPKLPSKWRMAANLAAAAAKHVLSGAEATSPELRDARLKTCTLCTMRSDKRCTACGCYLAEKASMASQTCPLGLWPATPQEITAPPIAENLEEGILDE